MVSSLIIATLANFHGANHPQAGMDDIFGNIRRFWAGSPVFQKIQIVGGYWYRKLTWRVNPLISISRGWWGVAKEERGEDAYTQLYDVAKDLVVEMNF